MNRCNGPSNKQMEADARPCLCHHAAERARLIRNR